jgi:hemoglobin
MIYAVSNPVPDGNPTTLYSFVGGIDTFRKLVDAFYRGVEADPVLRPLYPPDLDESREWLALFLAQYWGGPQVYSQHRGHPRLRMRHVPFVIGQRERDAWLTHMLAAVDEVAIAEPARAEMRRYFSDAATFMMNDRTNVEDRT